MEKTKRYQVISDNDGHDYIIPADRDEDFYRWVDAEENGKKLRPKIDFEPIRINCYGWTFTDPQGY